MMLSLATFAVVRAQTSPPEKEGSSMLGKTPFQLVLTFDGTRSLRATLVNQSDKEALYLADHNVQPSHLILVTPTGRTIQAFDVRRIQKRNRIVYRESFERIPPRGSAVLEKGPFKRGGKNYSLDWGFYHFEKIAPGDYRAQVVWHSEVDSFSDSDTGEGGKIPGIWKGKLESPWVEISLPKTR